MKVFLDVHVLQSVPPNCLNRDDTGSPKTAVYGGARRARVSSQSWKRAMRLMFKEYFDEAELSSRTVKVFDMVAEAITSQAPEHSHEDALKMAQDVLKKVKVEGKKAADNTDALFFLSNQQAKNLAAIALGADKDDEKEITKALKSGNGVDLALFGRMVASNPNLNSDACAQVAHAISTHRVETEFDFFTAVDDRAPKGEEHAGAGMLGTVEFNSATLYRYATVAVHDLFCQLAEDPVALAKAVEGFTRAFICSIPDGKQNTFAAHTVPDAVLVTLRSDRPLNLVGAFEEPIRGEGLAKASAAALTEYALRVYDDFCTKPDKGYVVGESLSQLGQRLPLDDMLNKLGQDVADTFKL